MRSVMLSLLQCTAARWWWHVLAAHLQQITGLLSCRLPCGLCVHVTGAASSEDELHPLPYPFHLQSHDSCVLQVPLALAVLASPELRADRLYSKSPLSWRLVTTTAGYFVYDFYVHRWRSLPAPILLRLHDCMLPLVPHIPSPSCRGVWLCTQRVVNVHACPGQTIAWGGTR
jgi:hypothetical protein